MKSWILRLRPSRAVAGKLAWGGSLLGVALVAYFWGQSSVQPRVSAQTYITGKDGVQVKLGAGSGYDSRVVGYVFKNIPVSREELGEYLIARFGAERLDFLINQKIIQMTCAKFGVQITDAEVDAQLVEDLKTFQCPTQKDFVDRILKRFNKTLFEWREDVIRPKLSLKKMIETDPLKRVAVSPKENDLRQGFEAKYGDMVECRMIVFQPEMKSKLETDIWVKIRDSEAEFTDQAKKQFIPGLASKAGAVPAVHRHFPVKPIEDEAFSLKPGQVSKILEMEDKTLVILKCVEHKKGDTNRKYEDCRAELHRELYEQRLAQAIPAYFDELKRAATPQNFLAPARPVLDEQAIRKEIGNPGLPPRGN